MQLSDDMWVWEARGGGLDALVPARRTRPVPGPGQVLVRVGAASLNYRDLGMARARRSSPRVPLSDGAGEVVEVGEGVDELTPGTRVVGSFFDDWVDGPYQSRFEHSALGGAIDGMLAEYVVRRAASLVPTPSWLSDAEAATLPCAAVTAWVALFDGIPVGPGQTVLLQGTGGVSIFALQLARTAGAEVIITSSSDAKLARAYELGANHGVNYHTTPDWAAAALRLTGGRGVDHVVEVAASLPASLEALATNGTISIIGGLGKPDDQPELSRLTMLRKRANLKGIYVGSTAHLQALIRAMEVNEIRPVIDRTFPVDEAADAYELLRSGDHLGKVVITA